MEPFEILIAGPEVDLAPLTRHLWAHRIVHRVVEMDGKQHLLLARPEDVAQVRVWIRQWQEGSLVEPARPPSKPLARLVLTLAEVPVTLLILLALIGVFGWMHVSSVWEAWIVPGSDLWPQQRWHLDAYLDIGLTAFFLPSILHFSLVHIVFNGLWWWTFGAAIERRDGGRVLLALFLVIAVLSSMIQWWYGGPGYGGASGVTMGLMGWIGWRQQFHRIRYPIPAMLLPLMVGWLLLTLVADTLLGGISGTGHGAHFGGLLCGFILAALWSRLRGTERRDGDKHDS